VCEWSTETYELVFNNPKYLTYWNKFIDRTNSAVDRDLDDCFNEYSREGMVSEDDLWRCPNCENRVRPKTSLQLWRVPDVFILQLKRFSADLRHKVVDFIDFPVTDLDLTARVGDKAWIQEEKRGERMIYDLFGVVNHYGGLGGGHYTACAQNFDENWYSFNGMAWLYIGILTLSRQSCQTCR
jgi:ubiquitin C-terminal hydrolase